MPDKYASTDGYTIPSNANYYSGDLFSPEAVKYQKVNPQNLSMPPGYYINYIYSNKRVDPKLSTNQTEEPNLIASDTTEFLISSGQTGYYSRLTGSISGQIQKGFTIPFRTGTLYFTFQQTFDKANQKEMSLNENVFKNLLKTLKFTTQTSQTNISIWKTYTNTQYGFQLTYPAESRGYFNGNFSQVISGECGQYIKLNTNPPANGTEIDFDSFFAVFIIPWKGSINDYVARGDNNAPTGFKSTDLYTLTPVQGSNADEAVVVGLKSDAGTSDNSPLGLVFAIYKKGGYLYMLGTFQGQGEGCTFPWRLVAYNENLANHEQWWNIPESFKFTQ